jgi:tRNA U34 2-thiouridine synthase MnmA/TrmU
MKAIVLFSGGLDSTLAVKVILAQGIEAIPVHFLMPFLQCGEVSEITPWRDKHSQTLGAPITLRDISEEFLKIVEHPRFGYGKNFNPCIDCKILMLRKAGEFMEEAGASFVATGEVAGQRPKSQHKDTLNLIEKESGLKGYLLRPLSAKLLRLTIPEEKKWIERDKLYGFSGRGRKPQMELAQRLGITDYSWPGGGCLLTNESFCTRIDDLLKHGDLNLFNIKLARSGRYFRLSPSFKLVVGKNEEGNEKIKKFAAEADIYPVRDKTETQVFSTSNGVYFEPKGLPGPSAVGIGNYTEDEKIKAAQIVARYTDSDDDSVEVIIKEKGRESVMSVKRLDDKIVRELMV